MWQGIVGRFQTGADGWESRALPPAQHGGKTVLPTSDYQPLRLLVRKLRRLASLSDDDVRAVENLPVIVRSLSAGQDLVREADRPSQACLVLDGWCCSYKLIEGGRRQILAFHLPGDLPDLLNLRMDAADFSVATLTPATIAFIPYESLHAVAERHGVLTTALWRLTLIDAAIFRQWMTGLGRRPCNERLAHLICELDAKQRALGLADEDGCPLPVTQADLADVLGMTNVHINRTLKDLRGAGLATLKNRRLHIHDPARLAAFANFDAAYLHLDALEPN